MHMRTILSSHHPHHSSMWLAMSSIPWVAARLGRCNPQYLELLLPSYSSMGTAEAGWTILQDNRYQQTCFSSFSFFLKHTFFTLQPLFCRCCIKWGNTYCGAMGMCHLFRGVVLAPIMTGCHCQLPLIQSTYLSLP